MDRLRKCTPRPRRQCSNYGEKSAAKNAATTATTATSVVVVVTSASLTTTVPSKKNLTLSFTHALPSPTSSLIQSQDVGNAESPLPQPVYEPVTPTSPQLPDSPQTPTSPPSPVQRPLKIIICRYPLKNGWFKKNTIYCTYETSRMDALQIHIAMEHWLCDFDKFIRLKFFEGYPQKCELCPDEHPYQFTSPLARFEHAVKEHLAFYQMLCPQCRRIYKNLSRNTYQNHRRAHHPVTDDRDTLYWGKSTYQPYVDLLVEVERCLQRNIRFNAVTYIKTIPSQGREFVCRLLHVDPSMVGIERKAISQLPLPRADHNSAVRKRGGGGSQQPTGTGKRQKRDESRQ